MDCVGIAPSLAKFQMQACEAVSARPHPDVLGLFPSFSSIFISFPEGFLVPPPSLLPPQQLLSILASRMGPACMPYTVSSSSVMPAACICSTVVNHSRIRLAYVPPSLCPPLPEVTYEIKDLLNSSFQGLFQRTQTRTPMKPAPSPSLQGRVLDTLDPL